LYYGFQILQKKAVTAKRIALFFKKLFILKNKRHKPKFFVEYLQFIFSTEMLTEIKLKHVFIFLFFKQKYSFVFLKK